MFDFFRDFHYKLVLFFDLMRGHSHRMKNNTLYRLDFGRYSFLEKTNWMIACLVTELVLVVAPVVAPVVDKKGVAAVVAVDLD